MVGNLNLSSHSVPRLPWVPSVYAHQGGHKWEHHCKYIIRHLNPPLPGPRLSLRKKTETVESCRTKVLSAPLQAHNPGSSRYSATRSTKQELQRWGSGSVLQTCRPDLGPLNPCQSITGQHKNNPGAGGVERDGSLVVIDQPVRGCTLKK